jgi:asparagine synthase (glutamine-hydrolysing)
MCGLFGVLGRADAITNQPIESALASLAHRGPDGQGVHVIRPRVAQGQQVVLGHRRLAIIDLSESAGQPMHDPETGNWIIYNGETYNFKALRKELEERGTRFVSQSDTEVLLKAFGAWGLEVFHRLAGMFALAIWDETNQRLILARDRLGIKPLYYCQGDGIFAFASEVRALLAAGLAQPRIDPLGLESYLAYGAVQAPLTIIEGVQSLLPAEYLVIEADGSDHPPECYWAPPFASDSARKVIGSDVTQELRALLEGVVHEHLVSDVPLGAFLSGGIDSSSLVILMSQVAPGAVHTFSVTFPEKEFSEAPYSRLIAKQFSAHHTEIHLTEEQLLSLLPDALAALDQPSIDGMNVYVISKAVRDAGVTVVLSGQGGDEIFAGYPTFRRIRRLTRYQPLWRALSGWGRNPAAKLASLRRDGGRMASKLSEILGANGDVLAMGLIMRRLFSAESCRRLFPAEPDSELMVDGLPTEVHAQLRRALNGLDPTNQMSLLELQTYLANMLLRDGDCMSMAHSLEVRVPFLDHRVVEFAARLPGRAKMRRSLPKPLLVKAMGDLLPAPIYERPKSGFTFPWEVWLRNQLRRRVGQLLDSSEAGVSIGLAPSAVQQVWKGFLERRPGITWSRVWGLFTLIDWWERRGVGAREGAVCVSSM